MTNVITKIAHIPKLYVLLPLAYSLEVTVLLIARYGGRLSDSDTSFFVRAADAVVSSGNLLEMQYTQGLGIQPVSSFVVTITGVPSYAFHTLIYPLFAIMAAVMAYALFKALLGSAKLAAISCFFLFLQPEFLFIVHRGNHEKITFILMILAMLLLVKGATTKVNLKLYAGFMGVFYLLSFALVTVNVGFALSWVFAVAASCALGYALSAALGERDTRLEMKRLFYITTSTSILVFIFVFYIYTPSLHFVDALSNSIEKFALLFLGAEARVSPYGYVGQTWGNPVAYVGLTIFNWVVLLSSFVMWVYLGYTIIIKRLRRWDRALFTLWLFYAAFGFQLAASIGLDQAGGFSSSGNLQVRVFPVFMLFAIPMAALALERVLEHFRTGGARLAVGAALLLFLSWSSLGGILKATNDPFFSNKWTFHLPQEAIAIEWSASHLAYSKMWVDFDERLRVTADPRAGDFTRTNEYDTQQKDADTKYLMLSEVVLERSWRLGAPLPSVREENKVYDNGFASIYHFRPRTIYQE